MRGRLPAAGRIISMLTALLLALSGAAVEARLVSLKGSLLFFNIRKNSLLVSGLPPGRLGKHWKCTYVPADMCQVC